MRELSRLSDKMIRFEDFIELEPFDGRKRRLSLKRTQFSFHLSSVFENKLEACRYKLRTIGASCTFQLSLVTVAHQEVFELKSLGATPFLHNGNFSFQCLLRAGDCVDLGPNRLLFKKADCSKEEALPVESWPKEASLCLEGETGSGKSFLAKKLHYHFVGEHLPFVAINLSAFSESLIESELFGHEKGSFTGALRERRGAVELAKEGTLFIDEIDSLPLHLQVKLLQFLDDKSYRRVGGERLLTTNCRLIFASGRPLRKLVKDGHFRSDLYFRISSGLYLKLKPLRGDQEKIMEIINEFSRTQGVTFSRELIDFYKECPWPGNIRQIQGHLKRKILTTQGQSLVQMSEIDNDLLDWDGRLQTLWLDQTCTLDEVKKQYCKKVFLNSQGSYEAASRRLGIAVSTLRRTLAA